MTPQHFQELLETICVTTHSTKVQVADYLNISTQRMRNWEKRNGLPRRFGPSVLASLRSYCFERIGD